MLEGDAKDKAKQFAIFQVNRKVTNLYKQFLFILEDLQEQGYNIPDEQFQRIRKRVLDHGNDCIRETEEYLESFETVVLFFDQDKHGFDAAQKVAELFTVGKCKIATLPLNDVNEMLVANRQEEVVKAMWESKVYRPDGVVAGEELWDVVKVADEKAKVFYPYEGLNRKLFGIRKKEIVTITGGSGIGKSLLTKEIAYKLIREDVRVGIISLDESIKRTCEGLMGLHLNKPIHIDRTDVSDKELKEAFDETVGNKNVYMYDHWGSIEQDTILNKYFYIFY